MFRKLCTRAIAVQSTALSNSSLLNRLLSSTQEAFLKGFDESIRYGGPCYSYIRMVGEISESALELADCFIQQGKVNEAKELILSAMEHHSSTGGARQRAVELMSMVDGRKTMVGDVEKLETVLARFVD